MFGAVVRAARGLGMTTVAEYVDREPLVDALRELGVTKGQGYYLGRPGKLDDLLVPAFATVREASKRVFGMRHFDVQLIGGMVMHEGNVAEMKTGEGKTLAAVLPAYLNALTGRGVHILTFNDYLAKRDARWMGSPSTGWSRCRRSTRRAPPRRARPRCGRRPCPSLTPPAGGAAAETRSPPAAPAPTTPAARA